VAERSKILIVDDEEEIRELLEVFFEMDGYDVATAENGLIAYEILQKGGIDIVVSDLRMPEASGIDLLKSVELDNNIDVPIVLLTAYTDLSKEDAFELGAFDVLRKPIKSDQLLGVVRSILNDSNEN
jgi:DNA-binding NtrC family response regulator